MLLLKTVRGLFALCHWLFIGSEQVFRPESKTPGTNQWFTSILSHQINQNVIFWETSKRIQFLKNTCPWSDDFRSYKVISVPTEVGALSSSQSQQIAPALSLQPTGTRPLWSLAQQTAKPLCPPNHPLPRNLRGSPFSEAASLLHNLNFNLKATTGSEVEREGQPALSHKPRVL